MPVSDSIPISASIVLIDKKIITKQPELQVVVQDGTGVAATLPRNG